VASVNFNPEPIMAKTKAATSREDAVHVAATKKTLPADPDAMSIAEFCRRHGISKTHFYNLPLHLRPALMTVGCRKLVSKESARAWRARLTAESNAPAE
jgi:hypothetical protein